MRLRPGSLVVLEGLDRSGKTTQREAFATARWDPRPLVTHMPSGITALTQEIYRMTEHHSIASPLARQLLHLACHAENLPALREAREERGVILDRWWWSTVAYGWFGGLRDKIDEAAFFGAISMAWDGFDADLILLFSTAFEADSHNVASVADGYRWLAEQRRDVVYEVPLGSEETTTARLLDELKGRNLLIA